MYSRIALAASLVIVFSISSSYASSQNSTLAGGNYSNPSLGISFQAPTGWTVEEPKKFEPDAPDVAVVAPYSANFTASISVNVAPANATTLGDFAKEKKAQLEEGSQASGVVLLSEQQGSVGGLPARTLMFEENFTSKGQSSTIKFRQDMVRAGGRFYTITYANDLRDFDSALPNYDQLLSSVKLGGGAQSFPFDYLSIGIVAAAVGGGLGMSILRKSRSRKASQPRKG